VVLEQEVLLYGARDQSMGLPLVELYIAKKLALFLAARAYGFKPLYRRCLEINDRAFAPRSNTNLRVRWMVRHSFDATLSSAKWLDDKARGTIMKITGKEPPLEMVQRVTGKKMKQ
jgi:hypothetical protein